MGATADPRCDKSSNREDSHAHHTRKLCTGTTVAIVHLGRQRQRQGSQSKNGNSRKLTFNSEESFGAAEKKSAMYSVYSCLYLLKIGPTRLRLRILSAGLPGFAVM